MSSPITCPIILASTSPRRIDLMKQVGLPCFVRAPEADETPRKGESPRALVSRLAREKAESMLTLALHDFAAALIIGADTIVIAPTGGRILNKPRDAKEACRMLAALAGKTHTVLTGYCILSAARESRPKPLVRVVSTKVTMRALTKKDIAGYVATGEPMDKAGAYAAQGVGMALIDRIQGSYTNVVGLPVSDILEDLEKTFGVPLLSWKEGASPRADMK
jgi:septum formation protein